MRTIRFCLLFGTLLGCVLGEHRSKRYLYVNPTCPITLGFILNVPLSLALPTLVYGGRSLDHVNNLNATGDNPEDFYSDPNYSDSLSKLAIYFAYMEIPTLSCQERLICEIAVNPQNFAPVSGIILNELRQKYGTLEKSDKSLMWRYMMAARTGYSSAPGECEPAYPRCPEPAHKLLNMSVIKKKINMVTKFCLIYVTMFFSIVHVHANREKRYIYLNHYSPITLGFIINTQISFALPNLVYSGRSLDNVNNVNTIGDLPEDFYSDPNYADQLSKLNIYFIYLEIPTVSCQERMICEMAVNPFDFSPVSELILKELRQKYTAPERGNNSLIWKYMTAARTGYISAPGDCQLTYHKCPEPAENLLNMSILKLWQFIAKKFGISLL